MLFHIYETTNNINGKMHIGQHQGDGNDDYLGSGIRITAAIEKYGRENFSKRVLCFYNSKDEINFAEKIKEYWRNKKSEGRGHKKEGLI